MKFHATENHINTLAQMLKNIYAVYSKLPPIIIILVVRTINLINHIINIITSYRYF